MPRMREAAIRFINNVPFVVLNVYVSDNDADRFLAPDAVVAAIIRAMQLSGIERTATIQLHPDKSVIVVNNIACAMPKKVKAYIEAGNLSGKRGGFRFQLYLRTEMGKIEVIEDDGTDDDPGYK